MRAFIELIVVQGLHNHVDLPTHQRGGSLYPVLTHLSGDCVQYYPLDRVGSFDHHAVLSLNSLALARDEEHQRVICLCDRADWVAMKLAMATTTRDIFLSGNTHHDVIIFNTAFHSLQQQHMPHTHYCNAQRINPGLGTDVVLLLNRNTEHGCITKCNR